MVETHYDSREDFGSIPREDASWEDKLNSVRKELASLSDNRDVGYTRQTKKCEVNIYTKRFKLQLPMVGVAVASKLNPL